MFYCEDITLLVIDELVEIDQGVEEDPSVFPLLHQVLKREVALLRRDEDIIPASS